MTSSAVNFIHMKGKLLQLIARLHYVSLFSNDQRPKQNRPVISYLASHSFIHGQQQ